MLNVSRAFCIRQGTSFNLRPPSDMQLTEVTISINPNQFFPVGTKLTANPVLQKHFLNLVDPKQVPNCRSQDWETCKLRGSLLSNTMSSAYSKSDNFLSKSVSVLPIKGKDQSSFINFSMTKSEVEDEGGEENPNGHQIS